MTAAQIAISILLSANAVGQALPGASGQHKATPSSAEPNAIVVTGLKPTRDAIDEFVGRLTVATDGQIATFHQPICPAAFGLPESFNRVIEQRLRDDAALVGLRAAAGDCDANVVVIVASNPAALLIKLQRQRPQMFVGLEFGQIQDVLRTKAPARTWQVIVPRGSDGRPLQRILFFGRTPIGGTGAWLNPAPANSRMEESIRPDLITSFVVIDANSVDGLTLTQIADYAAMRALARTRFSAELKGRSILGVIDSGDEDRATQRLTSWDIAYLQALYRTSNLVAAHQQQADIAGAMKRQLRGGSP